MNHASLEKALRASAVGLLLLLLLWPTRASADRLHLEEGGVIETDSWWVEDGTLMYESPAGTVGIPRSLVLRIETTQVTPPPQVQPVAAAPRVDSVVASADGAALRSLLDEGAAALGRRDFQLAASRFEQALAVDAGLRGARAGYAISEIALGRNERALAAVLDGLVRDPASADLHELLGDLRDREERVEDALRSWREAFRREPNDRLREKILKGERELLAGRDYAFSAAPHFNIRYDGQLDPRLTSEIAEYLEASYRELSDAYRHAPSQSVTVLLYPTRQFRDVTQAPDTIGGIYDGKIRVPLGGLKRIDEQAKRVLVHELTHAVIHSKARGNCPRWLHEGLAQRSEGKSLGAADRQSVLKLLRSTGPAAWDAQGFSYPAALSLTAHLESLRGFDGVLELLERLGSGGALDQALQQVYGEPYAELCRRWAERILAGGERR